MYVHMCVCVHVCRKCTKHEEDKKINSTYQLQDICPLPVNLKQSEDSEFLFLVGELPKGGTVIAAEFILLQQRDTKPTNIYDLCRVTTGPENREKNIEKVGKEIPWRECCAECRGTKGQKLCCIEIIVGGKVEGTLRDR